MSNEKKTRAEFEAEVVKKAQADKEFKKALLASPKETLGKLGAKFPADLDLKVVEESAKVAYLVLPANPDELTDEQLDSAAGGFLDGCYSHVCSGFSIF